MIFFKTEVRESGTHGEGLFLLEPVKKGEIIGILTHGCGIMTEDEYQRQQAENNKIIIMTAVRWVGKYFLYGDAIGSEEFINHSSDPTMLYHCGVCFATRDLLPGDELTADYGYFLAEKDVFAFSDNATGRPVDGISGREALLRSARELIRLVENDPDWGK
jgi:SET domain-containing protein